MIARRMPNWVSRGLLAVILIAGTILVAPLRSQDTPAISVLTRIPPDAVGFVYVKAGDLWKAELFAGLRDMLQKAGPTSLQAFNKRFSPAPSTIDSVCVYVTAADEDNPSISAALVTFTETFDATKVLKAWLPNGAAMNQFGQKYTIDRKQDLAIKAMDSKTLLITHAEPMATLLRKEAATDGPMKKHFKLAAGKTIYAAVNMAGVPRELQEQVPESFAPLLSAQEVVLSGQIANDLALNVRLQFADDAAAKAADEAAKTNIKTTRDQIAQSIKDLEKKIATLPEGVKAASIDDLTPTLSNMLKLAMLRTIDETLQTVPIKLAGNSLTAEYSLDPTNPKLALYSAGMVAGLMMPAVEKTREAATRAKGQTNLKQLATAMLAYHLENGHMPAAIFSKDGKKQLLSWRVALLPYIGKRDLYDQFKRDEAWDSENNKKLVAKMPDVFADIDAPPARESGQTHYQILVGGGAAFTFRNKDGTKLNDILDGASSTLMIVTATEPVTWSAPEEAFYDSKKPVPKLGFGGKAPNVAFFDGSVRALKEGISQNTLRALITRAGGELIGEEY